MNERTEGFKKWLLERQEENIVVVGHSAFFRDLIETECKMDNCEIRLVLLDKESQKFHSATTIVEGGQALLPNKPSPQQVELSSNAT